MAGPLLPLPPCTSLPVRSERPNSLESLAAELWIRWRYKEFFESSRDPPRLVTWQKERLFTNYDVSSPIIDLVMTILERDFRNVYTDAVITAVKKMLVQGATQSALSTYLQNVNPGGDLKPDMLGISAGGAAIEFDAVEVGTVKTAASTYLELQKKLSILRGSIGPQVQAEIPRLQQTRLQSFIPSDITVSGSAWRPALWERICPLPVKISTEGKVKYADWICFHPTMFWRAPSSSPLQPGDPGGENGLIIYHIHRLPAQSTELPPQVKNMLRNSIQQWNMQQGLVLQLNPALALALKADASNFDPAAKQMLLYLAAGALLLMVLGVAWEVGLVASAVELTGSGLAGLANSLPVLMDTMGQAGEIGRLFWPSIASAAPLVSASP